MKCENNHHTCCFIGHRKISEPEKIVGALRELVDSLIVNYDVNIFLFGSRSRFDNICYDVVTELKEKYASIQRIYVRAEYPYISEEYRSFLLQSYEDTYFPDCILNAGKAVYVERNYEMIDKSDFCIVYYDETYMPPKRKNCKSGLTYSQPKSGTKLAYDYAVRKCVKVINLLKLVGGVENG